MQYLLDTDTFSYLINKNHPYHKSVIKNLKRFAPSSIAVSVATMNELFTHHYRANFNNKAIKNAIDKIVDNFNILEYSRLEVETYGKIRATLIHNNKDLGVTDTMLAACAISNHLTLITHNNYFEVINKLDIAKLKIEDWVD